MKRVKQVLLLAGATCLGTGVAGTALGLAAGPAHADTGAPGSALGSYSLMAEAPGAQMTQDSPTASSHPQLEGEVPQSVALLQPGPLGYALSTVAWPGSLAGNGGSTLQLLGAPLPPSVSGQLNDPVRAEARTGTAPSSVTNSPMPGVTMSASVQGANVAAHAEMGSASGPAPGTSMGSTRTTSTAKLTGASSAVAEATSAVQNIDIGGVIKIASVVSTAKGSTDGSKGHGSGSTTFSGVTVAGFPATIDQSGLHVGPGSAPVGALASQAADQALQAMGMKVYVVQPELQAQGANVSYTAQSLLVYWAPPNSQGNTFTYTVGGASVTAGASPGLGGGTSNLVIGGGTGDTGTPVAGGSAPAGGDLGSAGLGGTALGSSGTGSTSGASGSAGPSAGGFAPVTTTLTANPLAGVLGSGVSWGWLVLALIGAAVIAAGIVGLPDRILSVPTTTCPLGETT